MPLIEELDTTLPPAALFEIFKNDPFCFFLDSSMDKQKLGRYSFMGGSPFLVFKSKGSTITLTKNGLTTLLQGNPFDILADLLKTYELTANNAPIPFTGGAVGYFSYDLCHFVERLSVKAVDDLQLPESYFGFYDCILACDNLLQKTYVISTGFPEIPEEARIKRAQERLNELKSRLSALMLHQNKVVPAKNTQPAVKLNCNFTRESYLQAIAQARQYIINGDIFEVNVSQRFDTEISMSPYELYSRLRSINPAPFGAFLDFGEVAIVSSSPERFLRVQGDIVETRPIKGTRRRGNNPEEDNTNAAELLNSAKDRAENMMIVDLERNDLGRVCRYGSVQVTELAILEQYLTVFHLTSTITGRLCADKGLLDLLKAAFPGGSITGAPKIRAMEIIDKLEPTARSVYTGSLGYLSFNGNVDLNIIIRTFLVKDNHAWFQVGGAVVFDSDPESEYQETLDKAKALIESLFMVTEQ
jgi:para-aminobenzoate synthetase component 1